MTAELSLTCESGHVFVVHLRERADGWQVTQVVAPEPKKTKTRDAHQNQ